MWIAIGCLVGMYILGISLAYYNLQDEESRQYRLEKRRAQRKARKRLWEWPR